MSRWWYLNEDYLNNELMLPPLKPHQNPSDLWWVAFDKQQSDMIEDAFTKGNTTMTWKYRLDTELTQNFDFGQMLYGGKYYLRRVVLDTDLAVQPWLFKDDYDNYIPMDEHLSATLSIALRNNYGGITLACPVQKSFDFDTMTQLTLCTQRKREIVAVPVQEKKPDIFLKFDDVPDKFQCPLAQDGTLMHNPVMAADGKIYEKEMILRWFASGKRTSPFTKKELPTLRLYPAVEKNADIQDWINAQEWEQDMAKETAQKLDDDDSSDGNEDANETEEIRLAKRKQHALAAEFRLAIGMSSPTNAGSSSTDVGNSSKNKKKKRKYRKVARDK
tara:strand:- start:59 stop:1051 length:993 start_codon:yes stop_codon:yes gene_type:complete